VYSSTSVDSREYNTLQSTVQGAVYTVVDGPSSTASLISVNGVPWQNFSKSTVAHACSLLKSSSFTIAIAVRIKYEIRLNHCHSRL